MMPKTKSMFSPWKRNRHRRRQVFADAFPYKTIRVGVGMMMIMIGSFLNARCSLLSGSLSASLSSEPMHLGFFNPTVDNENSLSYYWKENDAKNDHACQSVARHLQKGGRVLFYNFTSASNGPGMASLTLNLMQIALFMDQRWNRTHLVIDQRLLNNYRWDVNHGLFGGFLSLQRNTCILATNDSPSSSPEKVLANVTICDFWDAKCPILEIDADAQGYMFERARRVTKRYFMQKRAIRQSPNNTTRERLLTKFFHDLSNYTCSQLPGLRLRLQVHDLVRQRPMFLVSPPHETDQSFARSTGEKDRIDLAFHIRRGDKVIGTRSESRTFAAREYWDRFVNQSQQLASPSDNNERPSLSFQNCFVATDDYRVVSELQQVLQQQQVSGKMIPCQHLWTMTPPNYASTWQDRDEILGFLAQMRVLIHAKFFVGSFSSNVGGLVALLRGCPYHEPLASKDEYSEANRYRHYFDSYGVDWDEWGFL